MLVKMTMEDGEKTKGKTFYTCKSTGVPFLNRNNCLQYIVRACLEDAYEEHEIEVPPPTGKFPCVGRCTLGGELIGPPNWHGYREALEKLRESKYRKMSAAVFARKIEQVHEEEVVEEWRASQTKRRVYVSKADLAAARTPAAPASSDPASDLDSASISDSAEEETSSTADSEEATASSPEPTEPTQASGDAEAATEEGGAGASAEAAKETEPAEETTQPAEEPEALPEGIRTLTRNEAELEFLHDSADGLIKETRKAIFPARLRHQLEDSTLRRMTDRALGRERRFPLTLSFALRPAFRHMRFSLFRASQSHVFVTAVKPNPLPPEKVIPEIRTVLEFLKANPGTNREQLVSALCGTAEAPPAEKEEPPTDSRVEGENASLDAENQGQGKAAATSAPVDQATLQATLGPLKWLIDKGHVIEFFDGTLAIPAT